MLCGNRIYHVAVGGFLAFLLWGTAVLSQEVTPPVLKGQAVPEKKKGADESGAGAKRQEEDRRAYDLAPALNQIESAIRDLITQQRSAQEQGPAKHEIQDLEAQQDMALWAKAMFIATAVATGLTAIGVFLIWRTLFHTGRAAEYTKGMLEEAKKTTKAAQDGADAALRGAHASYEAVAQARASSVATIQSMDDTAERQLRAYVYIVKATRSNGSRDPKSPRWELNAIFRNYGQTPAYNVVVTIAVALNDAGFGPTSDGSETVANVPLHLPPGADTPIKLSISDMDRRWREFRSGNLVAYLYGNIEYVDAFGKKRRAIYRMESYHAGGPGFEFSGEGNYAS